MSWICFVRSNLWDMGYFDNGTIPASFVKIVMETPPNEKAAWFALMQWWVAHPLVGFSGTVASVVALGLYLYASAIPARELVITSDPAIAIVRGGQASSVDILYHGDKITTDVYARQVYVWNAGSDSIRGENILEPVGIVIHGATILETRIKKFSRPLTKIGAKIDGLNRVTFSWNILEHNDGAVIDVVYAAAEAGKIEGVGVVEHQSQVQGREYETPMTSVVQGWARILVMWVLGLLGVFLAGLAMWLIKSVIVPKQPLNIQSKILGCFFAIAAAFIAATVLRMVFHALQGDLVPPAF